MAVAYDHCATDGRELDSVVNTRLEKSRNSTDKHEGYKDPMGKRTCHAGYPRRESLVAPTGAHTRCMLPWHKLLQVQRATAASNESYVRATRDTHV